MKPEIIVEYSNQFFDNVGCHGHKAFATRHEYDTWLGLELGGHDDFYIIAVYQRILP